MSLEIKKNYSLAKLTSIKVGGPARFFSEADTTDEVRRAVSWAKQRKMPVFVLSGGSNVVVSDNGFDGLVIYINIKGFDKIKEDHKHIWLRVGAGELWDKVIERVVENEWWGAENMSWIPGKMGACVVQNSGAYGQELKNIVERVRVVERGSGEQAELNNKDCQFGYRQSIFNTFERDKYIIVEVVLKLAKQGRAKIDYPDVEKYFKEKGVNRPTIAQIRQAIIYIRENKLPNMAKVGSAGSFFKNLILSQSEFKKLLGHLKKNFGQEYVAKALELKDKFKIESGIKIPTAWLIEICGLKGFEIGYVKVYEKQPLVLITELGKARAAEVMELFSKVRRVVYNRTGMKLEPEPRMVGFSQLELDKYFVLN